MFFLKKQQKENYLGKILLYKTPQFITFIEQEKIETNFTLLLLPRQLRYHESNK